MTESETSSPFPPRFLGLAFCLIYPSTAIFKKLGTAGVLLFVISAFICLWVAVMVIYPRIRKLPRGAFVTALVLCLGLSLGTYFVIHPIIDLNGFEIAGKRIGASDGDDAIDIAIGEVLAGRYPYYAQTFLGNLITPMPGALILASPFYFLGDSPLQNFFWIVVFSLILLAHTRDAKAVCMLLLTAFLFSPVILYHLMQGGDYISNSLYLLAFMSGLHGSLKKGAPFWQSAVWAACLGVGLSSRLNYCLLLPSLYFHLGGITTNRNRVALLSITLVSALAVTLPFVLHDPKGFAPFYTSSSKLGGQGAWRMVPILLPGAAGMLAIWLGVRRRVTDLRALAFDTFTVQAFLMVSSFLLVSLRDGAFNFEYPHFGVLFLFFGLFALGPPCLESALKRAGAIAP